MYGYDWINPLKWSRAFGSFLRGWLVSIPLTKLGLATPALLASVVIFILGLLTYTSDAQWRRGLIEKQIRVAKAAEKETTVALLARRLLTVDPTNLDLQFESLSAGINDENRKQTNEQLSRMAKEEKYGRASLWLLEKEFSPVQWDQWDEKRRSEFGALLLIAVDDQPDNKMVTSVYADYLLLTGAQDKALAEITKLVSFQPARALQGAMLLREAGREGQANNMARNGLELLAKQGAEEPENVNLALLRAQFSLFLKQYENAILILNKSAKVADDKRLLSGTAETLVLWSRDQNEVANPTERFARQLTLLKKAVEIAPNHPIVVGELMTVAMQCADEKDPRVASLREMLVQGVAPEMSHFIQGTTAMMRDDLDEATLHLELAAKGLPTVPAVLNNLAVALATTKEPQLDRALKLVNAAITQVPNPYFNETRAQILLKQKKYREAIADFEIALPEAAIAEQVHAGLDECYRALGRTDIADQHKAAVAKIVAAKIKKQEDVQKDVKVNFDKTTNTKPSDKVPTKPANP